MQRFLREAKILRQLQHLNIVAFRDMGTVGATLFFAMEFVPGRTAAALVHKEGPLAMGRAVGLALQMLEGLAYAHDHGFVHRDLKPANLLVMEQAGLGVQARRHWQDYLALEPSGPWAQYAKSRLAI